MFRIPRRTAFGNTTDPIPSYTTVGSIVRKKKEARFNKTLVCWNPPCVLFHIPVFRDAARSPGRLRALGWPYLET